MSKEMGASVAAIVLAAGKGTRMKSDLPKVLHEVAGQPMIQSVVDALSQAGINRLVLVIGGELERFSPFLKEYDNLTVCVQENRRGTGDAVASAAVCFSAARKPAYASENLLKGARLDSEYVVVCTGDTPAINGSVISDFIESAIVEGADLSVLGMKIPDPTGYGRLIVGEDSELLKIVEHKDANEQERLVDLVNSGIILAKTAVMFECLSLVTPSNSQGEYYLTDIIEIAQEMGCKSLVYETNDWEYFAGVNSPEQKLEVEALMLSHKKK